MSLRRRFGALVAGRTRAGFAVAGGILLIVALDFASGVEIRVFPLYYAPIALAAWVFGMRGAAIAAGASALGWVAANQLAGMQFSHPLIWVINTTVQAASFTIVGSLMAGLKKALAREQALSRIDPLSGLMNHRAFYEQSARLLALCRRGGRPVTLAYLDLDDFKRVNDTHGHLAGDDLLRAIAQMLQSTLRSSDLIARLGGDEFAILLPELSPSEADQALRRLREAIAGVVRDSSAGITVSIGAITSMTAPNDVQSMVHRADIVMYAAKKSGKNQIRIDIDAAVTSTV